MKKILLIPDAHVTQNQDVSRFLAAGSVIVEHRPDYVILGGDFMAMQSISHWDENKRITMEGKRYSEEMAMGRKALNFLLCKLKTLQEQQKKTKQKVYKPQIVYLEGNHEHWVQKYVEQNPTMEGHIGIEKDLGLEAKGISFVPYKSYCNINDVLYTHVPMDGSHQAIRGSNICLAASKYVGKSCVFFHTHRFETCRVSRVGCEDIHILTAGCFFEEGVSEYGSNMWRGLTLLHNYAPGKFDIEQISMERLSREG